MFVLTGEGRKPPQTVQDRADLLNSMAAYTGMYRLEGDKWITQVDVAWNPEWVGTEQTRFFKLDGESASRHLDVANNAQLGRQGDAEEPPCVRKNEIEA
jgi:Lipocalin-like domain